MTTESQLHVGLPNIGTRERFLPPVNEFFARSVLSYHGPVVQVVAQQMFDLTFRK